MSVCDRSEQKLGCTDGGCVGYTDIIVTALAHHSLPFHPLFFHDITFILGEPGWCDCMGNLILEGIGKHIWVTFPRTGTTVKMWYFFEAQLWPNSLKFWRDFVRWILKMVSFWSSLACFFYLAIFTVFTPNRQFLASFEVGISLPEPMCPSSCKLS